MKKYFAYILVPFLLFGCAFVNVSLTPTVQPLREKLIEGSGKPKVLVMDISGIISGKEKHGFTKKRPSIVSRIKEELDKAESDRDIVGLIVKINSPGGTVTASDIIHHEITGFKKRKGVPVYAVLMNVAASGGYYAASAADRIYAHPTTITGSIGVIAVRLNLEGLLEKIGVEDKTMKSAEMKDIFSPLRPDTKEEREILQSILDQLHERFVEVVAEGRKGRLQPGEVEKLADGRPYTARQALENRLIDRIGYIDEAVAEMKGNLGIPEARLIMYERPGSPRETIYSTSAGMASPIRIDSDMLLGLKSVKFMYLWGVTDPL